MRRPSRGDRGSASLWLLGIGLCVVMFGIAVAGIGLAFVARHRAQIAADLGALAVARRVVEGTDSACARGRELVAANGARMVSCDVIGLDAVVRVEVDLAGIGVARASARAGPVRTPDLLGRHGAFGQPIRSPPSVRSTWPDNACSTSSANAGGR